MKLGQIINSQNAFLSLTKIKNGSLAIKLLSIKRKILPKIEDFNELRNAKIKEFSEDGNLSMQDNPEGFHEVSKYIEDMMNTEVDIDWELIKISELKDSDISMDDLEILIESNIIEE